jgi:hypothetical protein
VRGCARRVPAYCRARAYAMASEYCICNAREIVKPVSLEYSIEWLTCAFASRLDVVMIGLAGAAQDRLLAYVPVLSLGVVFRAQNRLLRLFGMAVRNHRSALSVPDRMSRSGRRAPPVLSGRERPGLFMMEPCMRVDPPSRFSNVLGCPVPTPRVGSHRRLPRTLLPRSQWHPQRSVPFWCAAAS